MFRRKAGAAEGERTPGDSEIGHSEVDSSKVLHALQGVSGQWRALWGA